MVKKFKNINGSWTATDASVNLKRLVVRVGWTDRDGREHNNSMVSYMMVD
jgi:hypothetical protein